MIGSDRSTGQEGDINIIKNLSALGQLQSSNASSTGAIACNDDESTFHAKSVPRHEKSAMIGP